MPVENRFTAWQVDHLIQLVGGNPMPNAIAGPLLVRPTGTLTLVYSEMTKPTAQRLQAVLSQRTTATIRLAQAPVHEADPAHISTLVQQEARQRPGRLGLDYTAGTKAMVVHAYRAVAGTGADDTVFAYLDPRPDHLIVHPADPTQRQESLSVRDIPVDFAQMMALQGVRLHHGRPTPGTTPRLLEAAFVLARYNQDYDDTREWTRWNSQFRQNTRTKQHDPQQAFVFTECPVDFGSALPQGVSRARTLGAAAAACGLEATELAQWLQGQWLEDITLAAFLKAQEAGIPLTDIQRGVSINMGPVGGSRLFEVDVMATTNHRLIATSCTVDWKRGKSKLLELLQRARQVGGDEARVCLVACLEQHAVDHMEAELQRTLNQKRYVRVFGLDDLLDLDMKLATWLQEANV